MKNQNFELLRSYNEKSKPQNEKKSGVRPPLKYPQKYEKIHKNDQFFFLIHHIFFLPFGQKVTMAGPITFTNMVKDMVLY